MSNSIKAGDTVYLIHAKQFVKITRIANSEMVYVEMDGDEIPVFKSHISKEIPEEENEHEISQVKNPIENSAIKTNKGIFISFKPLSHFNGDVHTYDICLVNDTSTSISFGYSFSLTNSLKGREGEHDFSLQRKLPAYEYVLLHSIEPDLLNELPQLSVSIESATGAFTGLLKQKIKPQNFFNKLQTTPLLCLETYSYKIPLEMIKAAVENNSVKKTNIPSVDPELLRLMMLAEPPENKDKEVGEAVEEIDLHIEKLTTHYKSMSNGEMLQMQISAFRQALERAIAHHTMRLFVIHGLGKGTLKDEIHKILREYNEVKSFNNNFNNKYGYGATEVILR